MNNHLSENLGGVLGNWVGFVGRHAWPVLVVALLLSAAALQYTVGHLGMITSTADMLSPDLRFLKTHRAFMKAFPQLRDTIVVVIDGHTPDLAVDARRRLAEALRRKKEVFKSVYAPGDEPFFRKNGLLYLSVDDLEELADRIAAIQPLLAELVRRPDVTGFFSLLSEALDAPRHGQQIDLEPVFKPVSEALQSVLTGRFYRLSWMELMNGGGQGVDKRKRVFIILQPRLDYSRLLPGKRAMQTVRHTAAALDMDGTHGLKVRLTGDIAMEFEELQSVTRGAKLAGLLSMVMVGIVLFAGLRSYKLMAAALITLVFGLAWTAGFAALAVGHLNMISVAFAVLFIGLAVDFAIHFCLRSRELLLGGRPLGEALPETAHDVGASLVLCAVTTAIGFFAFIPTAFSGVAELGLISGTGMFIGLAASLTVLPALLTVMRFHVRPRGAGAPQKARRRPGFLAAVMGHPRLVRSLALLAALGAIALLPQVHYDRNPLNLRDPSSESVATFRELLAQDDHSPWSLRVLAPDRQAAEKAVARLKPVRQVKAAVTIDDFIPGDQRDKMNIIEDIQYMVGGSLTPDHPPADKPSPTRALAAMKKFDRRLHAWIAAGGAAAAPSEAARALARALKRFLDRMASADTNQRAQLLDRLSTSLLESLPGRLRSLQTSLEASPFGIGDLPPDLVRRWVTPDGRYRVEILPRGDLNHRRTMLDFIAAVRRVEPDATGYPVVIHDSGKVVADAFKKAFALSLAAIVLLLAVLMPQKTDALLVLLPLTLSALFTGACMALFGLPLNFANIIALPLILGIGVDNGIHMVHRYHTIGRDPYALLHSSTVRGIVFATLTTICSFGNLALSPHPGMASMGKLLTIGISASLLSTLLILPAFFPKTPGEAPAAATREMENA